MTSLFLLPPTRTPDADGGVEAPAAGAGAGGRGGGHHARQRREGARERPEAVRVGQARGRSSGGGVAVSTAGKCFLPNERKTGRGTTTTQWCKILAECFLKLYLEERQLRGWARNCSARSRRR